MFSPEERQRAVELYFTTPMTTAQVVKRLGYPTRQCLERWLAADPRYAGHMAKPIIPLTAIITFKEGTAVKLQAKQPNYTISATIDNIANATNTPLSGFQVADGDGAMHNVTATITGNTLRIHSDEVKRIAQIQYLWQSNPNCSSVVYNNSNLPMSPFTLNVNQKTYSH